jgi:hypothetical protein
MTTTTNVGDGDEIRGILARFGAEHLRRHSAKRAEPGIFLGELSRGLGPLS